MGDDEWALMWVTVPQILPLWKHHWYHCPPGCGESPAAGEPPKTGMGRDGRGLSSLPWAGLRPSAGPRSLELMVEIPEDTAPLEPEVMAEGMGTHRARGLPQGPLCCTVKQPMATGSHLPRCCHVTPAPSITSPRQAVLQRGGESTLPPKAIPPTPRECRV